MADRQERHSPSGSAQTTNECPAQAPRRLALPRLASLRLALLRVASLMLGYINRESAIYNKGASKVRKGKLLVKCCQIPSLYHHTFSSSTYYRDSRQGLAPLSGATHQKREG